MITNGQEAQDAIFQRVKDALDAGAAAIVGSEPVVYWQDLPERGSANEKTIYLEVRTQQGATRQRSFGKPAKFTTQGTLYVQVKCPVNDESSSFKGRQLAELVQSAVQGVTEANGVWYRQTAVREIPVSAKQTSYRLEVAYEYDTRG
jgi:hypothetical protein